MKEEKTSQSEAILNEIISSEYKYGFRTFIETENFPKGLDLETVFTISEKKKSHYFYEIFARELIKSGKIWKLQTGLR
jgi:Fe-S cluster assembly protein SufB